MVRAADRLDVFGGVGNVQLAARVSSVEGVGFAKTTAAVAKTKESATSIVMSTIMFWIRAEFVSWIKL